MGKQTWTLLTDESGTFEGKKVDRYDEGLCWVVGGVLLPGREVQLRDKLQELREWWAGKGETWPPHASEVNDEALRTDLLDHAALAVKRLGGMWLLVVEPVKGQSDKRDLGRFVRMFGATVDLAARLVAGLGGTALDAVPAQRSLPLTGDRAKDAVRRGVGTVIERKKPEKPGETAPAGDPQPEGRVHAMLSAEVRHALDALAREPRGRLPAWPVLSSVSVEPAYAATSHPGLALADVGCNFIHRCLSRNASVKLADLVQWLGRGEQPMVVPFAALQHLRDLDRALRDEPPRLVTAGRRLAALEGDARVAGDDSQELQAGAAACGRWLWKRAVTALAVPPMVDGFARSLAAGAEAQLATRNGAYEGTWHALDEGWAGDGPLASAARAGCDRRLAARLWRLVLECANHRGDVETASRALSEFEVLLQRGRSQALLAEELEVRNLAVVTMQNRLPCSPEEVAEVSGELDRRTRALFAAAKQAEQPGAGDAPVTVEGMEAEEVALWRTATDMKPVWVTPDRERGMAYGTVARSLAFLGRLDDARGVAMLARSLFADSPFDRRINAATIARIELERARPDAGRVPAPAGEVLRHALSLCGAMALCDPLRVAALQVTKDPGLRFALDIALRALLWAPPAEWPPVKVAEQLCSQALREQLSRGELRSHPTELIARHAAELVRRHHGPAEEVSVWFALSIELSDHPGAGHTQRQLAAFTRRLDASPTFVRDDEDAPGSMFNPTFEYR
ncbi:MAG TPA: hypothetical protein VFA20_03185 [Myxococcaceae bacterium]|nr:hypothetical protein [Myxococcaceae bacterium]